MFEVIRHPISSFRAIRLIASQLTPAHLQMLEAAQTEAGKDLAATWIVEEITSKEA